MKARAATTAVRACRLYSATRRTPPGAQARLRLAQVVQYADRGDQIIVGRLQAEIQNVGLHEGDGGHMRLLAVITDLARAARFLRHRGEPTEPPARAPARDPPYWQSKIVRRHGQSEQSSQLWRRFRYALTGNRRHCQRRRKG
jgi:hypothetical protein